MERIHKWDTEDTIVTLYYVKHGLNGLPVKDEKELSECVIGASKASLAMQAANIRFILGYDEGVLTDFSQMQQTVVDTYNGKSADELRDMVKIIIDKRDYNENIKRVQMIQKQKEIERKKKAAKNELDEIFRRMGKDPSKMKKVVK